jgi:hypothetical protein
MKLLASKDEFTDKNVLPNINHKQLYGIFGENSLIEETNELLSELGMIVRPNSRYQQLVKYRKTAKQKLISIQEIAQLHKILTMLGEDKKWHDSIIKVFTKDQLKPSHSSNTIGRDTQFELYVAATFKAAGMHPHQAEPDIQCKYNDYPFSIAAKRIKSKKQLLKRVREASKQIHKSENNGIIALDLSPLEPNYFAPTKSSLSVEAYAETVVEFLNRLVMDDIQKIWQLTLHRKKVIGIIFFVTHVDLGSGEEPPRLLLLHRGTRLCHPGTHDAKMMFEIVESLSKVPEDSKEQR